MKNLSKKFLLLVLINFNVCTVSGCNMKENNSIVGLVEKIEISEFLSIKDLESLLGENFQTVENHNAFDDFTDKSNATYKNYNGSGSNNYPNIRAIKVTENIVNEKPAVSYLELILEKPIAFQQVRGLWGENFQLIVNRPAMPIGDRCVARYEGLKNRLDFGFTDCEAKNEVVKIKITKLSHL